MLGSPHHAIHRETAGYSAVHLALVPLSVIPAYLTAFATYPDRFAHSVLPFEPVVARAILGTPERTASARRTVRTKETDSGLERPARFGTETDRWGNVRLGMTEVREWDAFEEESEVLREKFETLYRQFSTETKREKVADVETFSERALNENGHAERTD